MSLSTKLPRLPLQSLKHGLPMARTRTTPALTHINIIQQSTRLQSTTSNSIPRIAQSSVWTSMIPRFIRDRKARDARKSEEWNPATFYIIIFILIGSQAIRMLLLKNDWKAYTRSTDAKIGLLREVIERVKRGEQVDVEKLLGTGDMGKEREWEEVLREIEAEDSLWHQKSTTTGSSQQAAPEQQQQQQQRQQERREEVSGPKEPVIPAESDSNEGPPKESQSGRKLNFF